MTIYNLLFFIPSYSFFPLIYLYTMYTNWFLRIYIKCTTDIQYIEVTLESFFFCYHFVLSFVIGVFFHLQQKVETTASLKYCVFKVSILFFFFFTNINIPPSLIFVLTRFSFHIHNTLFYPSHRVKTALVNFYLELIQFNIQI